MLPQILVQLEYLARILGAALCGMVVGYERENHFKTAGIRTHTIVALASAVMMIISKYGFNDILPLNHIGLDPSRVAAGIVTAIG
ncbi:MgtC/SapB family protein, partial [Faecalicatena contorta]